MKEIICENCGSHELTRKDNYLFCPYCESRFMLTDEVHRTVLSTSNHHATSPHRSAGSGIDLDDDVQRLLKKCKTDPKNARKYANLILDIDPDNSEAYKYL